MNFIIAAETDIGIKKATNQDSLTVKILNTEQGKMSFMLLCDGMGGLDRGEVASATLINAFDEWINNRFRELCRSPLNKEIIESEWLDIINAQNERLQDYGMKNNTTLGTTVVVLLLTETCYYLMNIGDSRAYEITDRLCQLTEDQTLVALEVSKGKITAKQAELDPRRSVLLQCVGASKSIKPDMFTGPTKKDAVYMLCSDGFRHEVTADEIFNSLNPATLLDFRIMNENARMLIELNKSRDEKDNISVAMVRTF